jgi:hypothetical protein
LHARRSRKRAVPPRCPGRSNADTALRAMNLSAEHTCSTAGFWQTTGVPGRGNGEPSANPARIVESAGTERTVRIAARNNSVSYRCRDRSREGQAPAANSPFRQSGICGRLTS